MNEWIAVVISAIALGFSVFSWYKTTRVSKGQLEIEVRKMISERKNDFLKYCNENDKKAIIDSLIEEEINAYDQACLFYKERKIDKKSFKKTYKTEILNLIEDRNYKEVGKFNDIDCKYENLINVYKEWTKIK